MACRERGGSEAEPAQPGAARELRLYIPGVQKGLLWQALAVHSCKQKESVLPRPSFSLKDPLRVSRRQSAAASWASWINTAGQSLVTDDCSPKRKQKEISAVGLHALVCPQRTVLLSSLAPGVSLGSVCISLSHDALIQSWSRTSSPAETSLSCVVGWQGDHGDSVKCLAAFPGLLEAARRQDEMS